MQTSPLLSRFAEAQARLGARPEAPEHDAVLTFGDVPAEYRAAREGCVLFDVTDRGRIDVEGGDAASFLHRILANDVRGLAPGHGNRNLLLTPKGKVTSVFDLARLEDRVELSVPPGNVARLTTALDMFLFTEDVRMSDTSAEHAPLELTGPQAGEVIGRAFGLDGPADGEVVHQRLTLDDGTTLVALDVAGRPGFRIDAGPEQVGDAWSRLREAGATPAGIVVRDIVRVESCSALFGVDIDDGVYPQEARLEQALSLEKGCYVGQEVVAKIDTYGGLNKRLFRLRVDHDDPIPRGARLMRTQNGEQRDLGLVTSWAYSFLLDTGLVLGYVKRKHQEVGTAFDVVGEAGVLGQAEIVELSGSRA